ncbi:unnamed protein product, partial [Rotaria sp. Silwood1]
HYEFQIPSLHDNEPMESSTHYDEQMSDDNNEQQLQQTSFITQYLKIIKKNKYNK